MNKKLLLAGSAVVSAVLLSVLIPFLASAMQEQWNLTHVTQTRMESARLEQSTVWTFLDRLQYTGVSAAQADQQSGEKMDEAAAWKSAQYVLDLMAQYRIIMEEAWTRGSAVPILCMAQGRSAGEDTFQAFRAWRCIFVNNRGDEMGLMIEEQTGKLLAALFYPTKEGQDIAVDVKPLADSWAKFCAEYYQLTLCSMDVSAAAADRTKILFQFESEAGEQVCLNLSISPENITFQE